jgi:hypothetical protein
VDPSRGARRDRDLPTEREIALGGDEEGVGVGPSLEGERRGFGTQSHAIFATRGPLRDDVEGPEDLEGVDRLRQRLDQVRQVDRAAKGAQRRRRGGAPIGRTRAGAKLVQPRIDASARPTVERSMITPSRST